MFKRAIGTPTVEEQARQDMCRAAGCIACQKEGARPLGLAIEIHHLTNSGRQISQDDSIALCAWHHRGVHREGITALGEEYCSGPSLAWGSKKFHEHYGSNDELLAYQNNLIGWTKPPERRSRERKRGRPDKILPPKV